MQPLKKVMSMQSGSPEHAHPFQMATTGGGSPGSPLPFSPSQQASSAHHQEQWQHASVSGLAVLT